MELQSIAMGRPGLNLICKHIPCTTVRVNQSQELERTREAVVQNKEEWSSTNIRTSLLAIVHIIDPNGKGQKLGRGQPSQQRYQVEME